MVIASAAGMLGLSGLRCSARLTGQLLILRLITRGLRRGRRGGSGCARISVIACSCAAPRLWGGKSRLGAGAATGGAEACEERQSVGDHLGLEGGVVHHATDRVVGT
jgi:hypothetical protein